MVDDAYVMPFGGASYGCGNHGMVLLGPNLNLCIYSSTFFLLSKIEPTLMLAINLVRNGL